MSLKGVFNWFSGRIAGENKNLPYSQFWVVWGFGRKRAGIRGTHDFIYLFGILFFW